MRRLATFLAAALLVGIALIAWGFRSARADPVVRRATVTLGAPELPPAGLRVALLSDIHVAGPDMPPERLARIVEQVNALRPDLVLIAGDFVSDKAPSTRRYSAADASAPLRALRAPLGVIAVLGNHDYWREDPRFAEALRANGIVVLRNTHVERGGIAIVGIDDDYTRRADIAAALAGLPRGRPPVVLSHSPDIVPALPPSVPLVVAGHTHCGQIALPLIGPLSYATRTGARYGCGHIREPSRDVFVSAGLGTSILPLRLGVPPDLWLLTLLPRQAGA